jgi:fido (protein-threonine AMPylation protein)
MYNLKDIVRLNQEVGESGLLRSSSSLDYALKIRHKGWLIELSYIIRSVLIDHPFVDGNKRTAYAICVLYLEDNNRKFNNQKVIETMKLIAKKNIKDINKIGRLILKC